MTKKANDLLTAEESDILNHAQKCHVHVKRVERHNTGHVWYCLECKGQQNDDVDHHHPVVDHKVFDTNQKMKQHMTEAHGVVWE